MKLPKELINEVFNTAKLKDIIPSTSLAKAGKDLSMECPSCKKKGKGKGFIISPTKNIGKCFSCGFSVNGAVDYLTKVDNMEYAEAVKRMADQYGISYETDEERNARFEKETQAKKRQNPQFKTFCERQLELSGLTYDDVRVDVAESNSKTVQRSPFRSGTMDQYGTIREGEGDDMIIEYYDLDGKPTRFKREKRMVYDHLTRMRWQNPGAHLDTHGRPIKYQSPRGSGSHIYIPERIRRAYKGAAVINRLYIQEGEKKAEKCCKHGILSVGVMGIHNVGRKNGLPAELQLIIQRCQVKEVVFLLDADWNQLHTSIKAGDRAEQRPYSFFAAVKNFKEYMRTLMDINLSVEIYFAHVQGNAANDKGIDDLLTNTLKGNEDKIKSDIETALSHRDGAGEYLQFHKITMVNDAQIADLWHLNEAEKFAEVHKEVLKDLPEFEIRGIKRRFDENGKLVMTQPLLPEETYYNIVEKKDKDGFSNDIVTFDYVNCFKFLKNRGFYRYMKKNDTFEFCRVIGKVIHKVQPHFIRDFVTQFTQELNNKMVLNMLYKGGPQYLGPEKLSNLSYLNLDIERAALQSQVLYFENVAWEINAEGIKEVPLATMSRNVWSEQIIRKTVRLIDSQCIEVDEISAPSDFGREFNLKYEDAIAKCDFLRFLQNASDMYWRKNEEYTEEESFEVSRHLLNKLTAIGYLLHDYKNDSELKAVIAMDGKLSEVGSSNGRTGKSLVGVALQKVIPQVYIPGKKKDFTAENFLFHEVTEATKNIFFDDVRAHFDFEFFFPIITGKLKVNPKNGEPFTLEPDESPKLFFSTNHAIDGEGSSFTDRQAFMVFSDYYNSDHKPVDDFGRNFFSEWDGDQWNLFYNLMATSLHLYFRAIEKGWSGRNQGIVPAPRHNINMRRLRQQIGEDFLSWAEMYYAPDRSQADGLSHNLGVRQKKQNVADDFWAMYPESKRFINMTGFKKRLKHFCEYKGYDFNVTKPNKDGVLYPEFKEAFPGVWFEGFDDKVSGAEYIQLSLRL